MFNNISPAYLSSLVPPSISSISTYNLRNDEYVQTIDSRTSQYFNSFLPSAVREWNNLPLETRSSDSVNSLKRSLNRGAIVVSKYYYSGNRKFQILHTRLRTNCSSLSNDLFLENISESPLCHCGNVEILNITSCIVRSIKRNEPNSHKQYLSSLPFCYKHFYTEIILSH